MIFTKLKKSFFSALLLLGLLSLLILSNPATSVSATQLSQQNGPIYIIQQGDTLSSIALRFGLTADELQSANSIEDPNAIQVGQQLVIPGLEDISGFLTSKVISYGTSLTYLSRKYQIENKDLITLNHLVSPSEAIAGLKIIVAVDEEEGDLSPLTTVLQGETPLEKAIKAGTSVWKLVDDNHLKATWDMLPRETLFGEIEDDSESILLSGLSTIEINPLPAVQGETLEIKITADKSTEFTGTFNDKPLQFFTENREDYYNLSGIHALAEVGPLPLQITMTKEDGSTQIFEQMVLISSGNYGNDMMILVDDIYVDPDTIAMEDEIINNVVLQYSKDKYWDGQFQYPIDEPCINGYFGQRRNYNDGALNYYHTGLDFGVCAPNLNIYAPAAGVVVLTEEMTVRGNALLIDHGWGVYSGYWHLKEFKVDVGDTVQPGDLLGIIGDTGRSLGAHLHFEIDIGGTPVNPQTWLEQVFP